MTKEALKLALEALEQAESALARCLGAHKAEEGDRHRALAISRASITAIKEALANEALEKMAENARELGLDYEPEQEPVAWMQVTKYGNKLLAFTEPPLEPPCYTGEFIAAKNYPLFLK